VQGERRLLTDMYVLGHMPGGSNINQSRSASGAHVKIHEADPGQTVRYGSCYSSEMYTIAKGCESTDISGALHMACRLIEITGPPDRVEIAKTMIQAFMAGDATGAAAAYQGKCFCRVSV
jgi:hypothetical protein